MTWHFLVRASSGGGAKVWQSFPGSDKPGLSTAQRDNVRRISVFPFVRGKFLQGTFAMDASLVFGLMALIFFVSGFKQGLTGFGFGIIAMALLPLIMEVSEATVIVVLIGTLSMLGHLGSYWKSVSWKETRFLLIGIITGIPLGVFLLSTMSPTVITRVLGAVLISTAAVQMLLPKHRKLHLPAFLALPLGVLSGLFGGAFNMGGPPALIYLQSRPLKTEVLVATLQVIFTISFLFRSCLVVGSGLVDSGILLAVAIGILPTWIGLGISPRFRNAVSQETFRRIVLIALLLMGLKYLVF